MDGKIDGWMEQGVCNNNIFESVGMKILNSKILYIVIVLIVNMYIVMLIKKLKYVKYIYIYCVIFLISLVF